MPRSGLLYRVALVAVAATLVGIATSVEASAQAYAVSVTPDGTSTPERDANTGGYSALFIVMNTERHLHGNEPDAGHPGEREEGFPLCLL